MPSLASSVASEAPTCRGKGRKRFDNLQVCRVYGLMPSLASSVASEALTCRAGTDNFAFAQFSAAGAVVMLPNTQQLKHRNTSSPTAAVTHRQALTLLNNATACMQGK